MAHLVVFSCFALLAIASALAARVGHRGQVCDSSVGYEVPDVVKRDPVLRQRANDLIAFWCTGASALSAAALVPVGSVLLSDGSRSLSTPALLALALYALGVVVIGAYPFERINHPSR